MKRVFTLTALVLFLLTSASVVSAQNNVRAMVNAYEHKVDQLQSLIDQAASLAVAIEAEKSGANNPQVIADLENQLAMVANRMKGSISAMTSLSDNIGHPGLTFQTARLGLFPTLIQAGGSGSSSSGTSFSSSCDLCDTLDDMSRITGDDIRREIQEVRNNL